MASKQYYDHDTPEIVSTASEYMAWRDDRNVRKELEDRFNMKELYYGIFQKYGIDQHYDGFCVHAREFVLLTNIETYDGKFMAPELWIGHTNSLASYFPLKQGDRIFFEAKGTMYEIYDEVEAYTRQNDRISNETMRRYADPEFNYNLGYTKVLKVERRLTKNLWIMKSGNDVSMFIEK